MREQAERDADGRRRHGKPCLSKANLVVNAAIGVARQPEERAAQQQRQVSQFCLAQAALGSRALASLIQLVKRG